MIDSNITTLTSEINSSIKTITPEDAKRYLERNCKNRPVRKKAVEYLKNAILRGEWIITHQGIALDEAGFLIDGQHRLMAIIEAGIPVDVMVTWGVERKAFSVIDTPIIRNLSDLLSIDKRSGEVVNLLSAICYHGNITKKTTAIQAGRISEFIDPIHEKLSKSTVKGISTAPVRGYICYLAISSDYFDYASDLYKKLVTKDFKGLPPIGECLLKAAMKGVLSYKGAEGQSLLFSYSDYTFNPRNKSKTRFTLRDSYELIREMRKDLRSFFIDNAPINQENKQENKTHIQLNELRV